MAPVPLFDLNSLDLSQTRVSPDGVGAINPQAGDMRQVDRVILLEPDTGKCLGVKRVREDEFWVPLHIPGRPLMPGVLMIEAAAQVSSVYFHYRRGMGDGEGDGAFLGFTRCEDTRFRGQVVPGDDLYLLMQELSFTPRRVVSRTQGLVNGKIVFESTITGMVL